VCEKENNKHNNSNNNKMNKKKAVRGKRIGGDNRVNPGFLDCRDSGDNNWGQTKHKRRDFMKRAIAFASFFSLHFSSLEDSCVFPLQG
jgi:hypothetical protein